MYESIKEYAEGRLQKPNYYVAANTVEVPPYRLVRIDVKPESTENPIQPESKGVTPVAILKTPEFDPVTVDPQSVEFGPDAVTEEHRRGHSEDVDGDRDEDLMLHFATEQTDILPGDTEVWLLGRTRSGTWIAGRDAIRTVPPGR
jgi:hypothetical protein